MHAANLDPEEHDVSRRARSTMVQDFIINVFLQHADAVFIFPYRRAAEAGRNGHLNRVDCQVQGPGLLTAKATILLLLLNKHNDTVITIHRKVFSY